MKFRILTGHKTTIIELKKKLNLQLSRLFLNLKISNSIKPKNRKTERPLLNFLLIVF